MGERLVAESAPSFFLLWYVAHLVLRSFPTRRSSDLSWVVASLPIWVELRSESAVPLMPASWVVVTPASWVGLSEARAVASWAERMVALGAPNWVAERAAIWVSANSATSVVDRPRSWV